MLSSSSSLGNRFHCVPLRIRYFRMPLSVCRGSARLRPVCLPWISQMEFNPFINAPYWNGTTVRPFADVVNCQSKCLISSQSGSQPLRTTRKSQHRSLSPDLTPKVTHLALGSLNLITIPVVDAPCYPGLNRSLPILSSISPNISWVTITSASWNVSLLAWRTKRPPILMSLV